MSNIHNMTTRSKKNNNDIINTSNNPNDNIDKDLDDVDEYGNIKDLIDYDCDDEFDRTMLNEELNKLRKRKIYDTNERFNKICNQYLGDIEVIDLAKYIAICLGLATDLDLRGECISVRRILKCSATFF